MRFRLGGNEDLSEPFSENETLWAAFTAKACGAASVPLKLYRSADAEEADEIEDAASDKFLRLFSRPNAHATWTDFMWRAMAHRMSNGEDWWLLADAKGNPVYGDELTGMIQAPEQIIQAPGGAITIAKRDAYGFPSVWRLACADGSTRDFPNYAVVSFIDPDPSDQFRGLGAAQVVARWMGAQFQAQRYLEGLTRNSGEPSGVITYPENVGDDELKRLEAIANDNISDPQRRGQHMVIRGNATFTPNQLAPKDMEFGTLFATVEDKISQVTGVPLPVLGIYRNATYSNASTAMTLMWTGPNGIVAYLRSIEQRLNTQLFPRIKDRQYSEVRAYFDTDDIAALQEDVTDRVEACARVSVQLGAPYNTIASELGLEPIDEPWAAIAPDPYGINAAPDAVDAAAPGAEGQSAPDSTGMEPADGTLAGRGAQDSLPNGAQAQAAVDIVAQVAAGTLPRDSGHGLLQVLFGMTADQADLVLGSAGKGTATTPNVNPAASATDPSPAIDAPVDGPSKGMSRLAKGSALSTRSDRIAYQRAREKAVLDPAESVVKKAALAYLAKYVDGQLARLRAYARSGETSDSAASRAFASEAELLRQEPDFEARVVAGIAALLTKEAPVDVNPELARQAEVLLLNRAQWDAKMVALFSTPIKKATALALSDAAAELDSASIGVGHPAIVEAMQSQLLKLAADVNGTLADRVRTRLMEGLAQTTEGTLQERVREVLPDLEESLKTSFANRDARAQLIARTEGGKAASTARYEQFKADGIVEWQWTTEGDSDVRPEHLHVDGEIRALGQPFSNGLTRPRDPQGAAEQVINCRCEALPIFEAGQ